MADIKDTEIRFIGDDESFDATRPKKTPVVERRTNWWVVLAVVVLTVLGMFFILRSCDKPEDVSTMSAAKTVEAVDELANAQFEPESYEMAFEASTIPSVSSQYVDELLNLPVTGDHESYCLTREATVNDIPFRIYLPLNATPEFHVGKLNQNDESIILAMQAADIRKDNGQIVGACVNDGEMVSKGLAKKGYVAIIDQQMTIGYSEHSPLFEEAIERGGDFFRQYPIVSDGRIVENNPKNLSIRRAICQRGKQFFVVETLLPVSFHDFSQMLVDFHVQNAVYLVGSQYACGFSRNDLNQLITWGEVKFSRVKNISYLVWRRK